MSSILVTSSNVPVLVFSTPPLSSACQTHSLPACPNFQVFRCKAAVVNAAGLASPRLFILSEWHSSRSGSSLPGASESLQALILHLLERLFSSSLVFGWLCPPICSASSPASILAKSSPSRVVRARFILDICSSTPIRFRHTREGSARKPGQQRQTPPKQAQSQIPEHLYTFMSYITRFGI